MATRFFCSTCGKQFEVADSLVGHKVRCSGCGGETRVPGVRPAPAAPTQPASSSSTAPAAGIPLGKPIAAARPATDLPIGKPVEPSSTAKPAAALPQAVASSAQPAAIAPGAVDKVGDEQYDLVYDEQAATSAAPIKPALAQATPAPTAGHQPAQPTAAAPQNPTGNTDDEIYELVDELPAEPTATTPQKPAGNSDDENYELVYDELPAKPAAPASRPETPGMAVGQPIQSPVAPQGLPLGKPIQARQPATDSPVGKPIAPTKPAPPAAGGSPAANPVVRPAAKPKPASSAPAGSAAPSSPTGVSAQPAARSSQRTPAAAAPANSALTDGLPDLVLTDAIVDAFGAPELESGIADVGRRCARCLTRLSANSNICPSCGFDSTVAEVVAQELPAELIAPPGRKGRQSANREMRFVRLGLYGLCIAQFLVLIAIVLQLIATLGDEPLRPDAPSPLALATAGCAGLGFLCSCVSSVLCLSVPKRAAARGMLYFKNACDALTIAIFVQFVHDQLSWKETLLIAILPITSVVLFIVFMRNVAIATGRDEYVQNVTKLLWKALGLVVVVALSSLFSAMVGSETFMLARVLGLAGWMYVLFQFTLSAQQLAVAEIPPAAAGQSKGEAAVPADQSSQSPSSIRSGV